MALWPLLIAQFAIDRVYTGEGQPPYPTITMPDFDARNVGIGGQSRITQRTIEVIDQDGTATRVYASQLLAPLKSGPASSTLDRLLKPVDGTGPTQDTVRWLRDRTLTLKVTPEPVGLRIVWQPVILDVANLRRTPAGEPAIRELHW